MLFFFERIPQSEDSEQTVRLGSRSHYRTLKIQFQKDIVHIWDFFVRCFQA